MPKDSSDSVNAILLDRERDLSRLRELARYLREADPRVTREEFDHRNGRPMIRRALEEGVDLLAS
jgi:hypothetical protein